MFILPTDVYAKPDGTITLEAGEDTTLLVVAGAAIEDEEAVKLNLPTLVAEHSKKTAEAAEASTSITGRLEALKAASSSESKSKGKAPAAPTKSDNGGA